MRYMTDAMLSGLAKELRAKGIECETLHKLILGTEDSRISIKDPRILEFLINSDKSITLITTDSELADYCKLHAIPCIRVQDLVAEKIFSTERK